MRQTFRDIISGWTLIDGFDAITEKIEQAAKWTKANGPLEPDEEATIKMMIECQVARGLDEFPLMSLTLHEDGTFTRDDEP
jgi:hypothetical protein